MVRPTVNDGRFMMGEHRVPPASLAEKRRLNALASRGGGDRSAIAKVAKKQKGASLATAYAHRYADVIADHELSALLQQNSFDDHEELVTVGARVGVPSSHPNKYGYATTAVVVNVSGRQCAGSKHRTLILTLSLTLTLTTPACAHAALALSSQQSLPLSPSLALTLTLALTPSVPFPPSPPGPCAGLVRSLCLTLR